MELRTQLGKVHLRGDLLLEALFPYLSEKLCITAAIWLNLNSLNVTRYSIPPGPLESNSRPISKTQKQPHIALLHQGKLEFIVKRDRYEPTSTDIQRSTNVAVGSHLGCIGFSGHMMWVPSIRWLFFSFWRVNNFLVRKTLYSSIMVLSCIMVLSHGFVVSAGQPLKRLPDTPIVFVTTRERSDCTGLELLIYGITS